MDLEKNMSNNIEDELLSLIKVNRDAYATNRGFFYQYLNVILKWVTNYINDKDIATYTEVDDDIMEVGDGLVFTQLKCYASSLGLQSMEVKKALFGFFVLYIENRNRIPQLMFSFSTNTKIGKNDKLLSRWFEQQPPNDPEVLSLCAIKVAEILNTELKKIRDKQLSKGTFGEAEKSQLKDKFIKLGTWFNDAGLIDSFIEKIRWEFESISPELAITEAEEKVAQLLKDKKFYGRPVKTLLETLLSEVYRCSQYAEPEKRKLTGTRLKVLLEEMDRDVVSQIDNKVIHLFKPQLDSIHMEIDTLRDILEETVGTQRDQALLLEELISKGKSHQPPLPKLLTRQPYVESSAIIGREEMLLELDGELADKKHVSVSAEGGVGKTMLLNLYLTRFENHYDHIIWISAGSGLVTGLITNPELASNLRIPFLEPEKFPERWGQILTKLNSIPGNNLLVVDGYGEVEAELTELKSLKTWKVIVGTRLKLVGWNTIKLKFLSFDDSKRLYFSHCKPTDETDEQFELLFDQVGYNTFAISLVAKTIHYSFDKSLREVLDYFDQQSLDAASMDIKVPDEFGGSAKLLNTLIKTFELNRIESFDKYFLIFFALLPLEETYFNDIIDWFGEAYAERNTVTFTDVINKLHLKGLIERSGKQIIMHKMFRDCLLYQERQEAKSFISQFQNLSCLTTRLKEGADSNLAQAVRFLKFGQSYLQKIKEPFRSNIYQPMLLLENEVLNIQSWLKIGDNSSSSWKDLYERAKKYLGKHHGLVGTIANNYGLSLVGEGDMAGAFAYIEESIIVLKALNETVLPQTMISLCNLGHLFLGQRDFKKFKQCFASIDDLRKKYKLYDDVSYPIQAHLLGYAHHLLCDFKKAKEFYNVAIKTHRELPDNLRNEAYLVGYFIDLGFCYLLDDEIDKAEKAAIIAMNVLSKLNVSGLVQLRSAIKLMIEIAEVKGDNSNADKLRQTLNDMN